MLYGTLVYRQVNNSDINNNSKNNTYWHQATLHTPSIMHSYSKQLY